MSRVRRVLQDASHCTMSCCCTLQAAEGTCSCGLYCRKLDNLKHGHHLAYKTGQHALTSGVLIAVSTHRTLPIVRLGVTKPTQLRVSAGVGKLAHFLSSSAHDQLRTNSLYTMMKTCESQLLQCVYMTDCIGSTRSILLSAAKTIALGARKPLHGSTI